MPSSAAGTWGRQCPGWDSHPHSSDGTRCRTERVCYPRHRGSAQLLAESAGRLEARSYGLRTLGTQPPTPTAFCRDHLTRVIRDREWHSPRGPPVDYRRKTGGRHCPPCVRRNAFRAVDGTRTRDHLLGKQEPYQLGHYRMVACRESSRSLDSDLQSEIEELPAIALRAIACSHEPAATCVICPQSM